MGPHKGVEEVSCQRAGLRSAERVMVKGGLCPPLESLPPQVAEQEEVEQLDPWALAVVRSRYLWLQAAAPWCLRRDLRTGCKHSACWTGAPPLGQRRRSKVRLATLRVAC